MDTYLGVDIGGTGIKGAPVDVRELGIWPRIATGSTHLSRQRRRGSQRAVAEITRHFDWEGPVGLTFPAIVKRGVVYSASNVDQSWDRCRCR